MAMEHTQLLKVDKSADEVWEWVKDARNFLAANIFHEYGDWPEPIMEAGVRVPLPHNFFGLKERRGATIREYRKYHISYGDYKLKEEKGTDTFPHNLSLTIVPIDDKSCILMEHIKGVYVWPVPKFVREWAFRKFMPVILYDDLCVMAVAVGAMSPDAIKKPLGLFLWPAMVLFGGKFIKGSSRTKIIEGAKSYKTSSGQVKAGSGVDPKVRS